MFTKLDIESKNITTHTQNVNIGIITAKKSITDARGEPREYPLNR